MVIKQLKKCMAAEASVVIIILTFGVIQHLRIPGFREPIGL
jgi:hypothetical protein